jgi:hypothetical protein
MHSGIGNVVVLQGEPDRQDGLLNTSDVLECIGNLPFGSVERFAVAS